MDIHYARQSFNRVCTTKPSIMLCGPTPRTADVKSWRPEAINFFQQFGFDGTLFIPEDESGGVCGDYDHQIEWEEEALHISTCIMFWIPRNKDTMLALTTNTEFGFWANSGKCVLGTPPDAFRVKYQRHYAAKLNIPISDTLEHTVEDATKISQIYHELSKIKYKTYNDKKITFVHDPGGDWTGMFIDGKLVLENHSLHYSHVLEALDIPFENLTADGEWLEEVGSFPKKLSKVKLEK